ncbi:hypothetical protein LUX57_27270 [Actinomadura madurae]|nr:hypothetical protein [Actinomadura madurae]
MAMTRVRPSRVLFKTRGRPTGVQAPNRDSAVIDWAAYIDGHRVSTDTVADAVRLIRDGRLTPEGDSAGFVWVGLHEPSATELADLAEVFGLHPLAVEDAIHAHQRPKLERYDDVHFVVMKTVGYVSTGPGGAEVVETGEIMIFCGPDFVVTVRHGTHGALGPVRRDLEQDPARLALGPAAVLHAVADRVVDGYVGVADAVMEDIDEVEEAVFSPSAPTSPAASTGSSARSSSSSAPSAPSPPPAQPLRPPLRPRRDQGIPPRRRRPPHPRPRAGRVLRRTPQPDPPGPHDPGHRRRQPGHAQDLRLGRHLHGPHRHRGRLRHELRLHARNPVALRLPHDPRRHRLRLPLPLPRLPA